MAKYVDYQVKHRDEEAAKPKTLEDVLEAIGKVIYYLLRKEFIRKMF